MSGGGRKNRRVNKNAFGSGGGVEVKFNFWIKGWNCEFPVRKSINLHGGTKLTAAIVERGEILWGERIGEVNIGKSRIKKEKIEYERNDRSKEKEKGGNQEYSCKIELYQDEFQ